MVKEYITFYNVIATKRTFQRENFAQSAEKAQLECWKGTLFVTVFYKAVRYRKINILLARHFLNLTHFHFKLVKQSYEFQINNFKQIIIVFSSHVSSHLMNLSQLDSQN